MTRICKSCLCIFYLFIVLLSYVCCEVVVRETKIDPFSFLFEKQSLLIDRIDSIAERLQNLESNRADETNTLRINGWQSEEKLAQIYSGISSMEAKFDKLSDEISSVKSLYENSKNIESCNCANSPEVGNYLFPLPSEDQHSEENELFTEKETITENEKPIKNEKPINNEKTLEEITSMFTIPNIKLPKVKEIYQSQNDSVDVESILQNIAVTLNDNLEYASNKLKDIVLQTFLSANHKQDNQFLLGKSRENVSRALLKMIDINQRLVGEQIERTVTEELKVLKGALSSEVTEMKKVINVFKGLIEQTPHGFIKDAAVKPAENDYLLNTDDNDFLVRQDALNDTNSFASISYTDAVNNQTDTENETLTDRSMGSVVTFLNDMKLLPLADHDIIEKTTISNQLTVSETEATTKPTEKCCHQNENNESLTLDSILNMSNLTTSALLQKINNLQTSLSLRMKKVEDQIIGFKIYQSSALHSHMKEVRFELSKGRELISKSVAATGNKLSKKMESNKLSLYGFMNAAVTSITSSAVTSSKATGVAISKTLRNIFQQLQNQVVEMSWFGSMRCPGLYQKVGSSCLLVVDSMKASWMETCTLCLNLGGEIPKISKKDLSILKQILSNETDGVWVRTENSSTHGDTCSEDNNLTPLTDNLKVRERGCTAYLTNGTIVEDVPCSKQLPVICQRSNVLPSAISKDFNISRALSDLDSFIENSKYFKFRKIYL